MQTLALLMQQEDLDHMGDIRSGILRRSREDDETTEGYEVEAPASPASSWGGPLRAILAHTTEEDDETTEDRDE